MKNEIKIGLLGLAALLILIFGYKYLKGQNILDDSKVYFIKYEDVEMLDVSNPVLINGFKVGSVIKVGMDDVDANLIKVTIDVKGDIKLPQNTVAVLLSTGVLGDKAIELEFDQLCTSNCLPNESTLPGMSRGFLKSMVGTPDELSSYVNNLTDGIDTSGALNQSLVQLQYTIQNLNSITAQLDNLLRQSGSSIDQSLKNISSLTGELASNKTSLGNSLQNLESFTQKLDNANIDQLAQSANSTIQTADKTFASLETTLSEIDVAVGSLQQVLGSVQSGEGTLGALINDKSLYDRFDRLAENLDLLMQDVRLNPKRYINVSVFGKKQKDYEVPEDDPAFEDE